MEDVMKQTFTVSVLFAATMLMTIQFTAAQEPVKKFSTEQSRIFFAIKNIIAGLQSDNEGVVESALRLSAEMKMRYPDADMSGMIRTMNSIKKNHRNGTIRYKAFIVLSVCENPEWYTELMGHWQKSGDAFFRTASNLLNDHLLTSAE